MIPPSKAWHLLWKKGSTETDMLNPHRPSTLHTVTVLYYLQQSNKHISVSSFPRFLKLHSAVIRTTVLIQHYCVALMAASGRINDSHNLHKHTSVETLEIVQSLLAAAQQCPSHHGHMVLLRIPSLALAAWAHRRLSRVRRQLGLEQSFEIILGNPNQALNIGQSFIDQIKVGRNHFMDRYVYDQNDKETLTN